MRTVDLAGEANVRSAIESTLIGWAMTMVKST